MFEVWANLPFDMEQYVLAIGVTANKVGKVVSTNDIVFLMLELHFCSAARKWHTPWPLVILVVEIAVII